MIQTDIKYSYNDITIEPAQISNVRSRSECNPFTADGMLPIFASPMASVVSHKNYAEFYKNHITPIIPRNVDIEKRKELMRKGVWVALSLNEFKELFVDNNTSLSPAHYRICVDIANGHMRALYDMCELAKAHEVVSGTYQLTIMTGNIANPLTLRDIAEVNINFCKTHNLGAVNRVITYCRVGIGSGSACITTSNVSIHYPMASLIDECNSYRQNNPAERDYLPYIVADGGIRNYSDVIKALALGADYVMIGGLFGKALESCGAKMFTNYKGEKEMCTAEAAYELYERGAQLYTRFFGMASGDGQIAINHTKNKTAEGITKMIPVEFKLYKWAENMADYLRSAMSYCNCFNLQSFIGQQTCIVNSFNAVNAVNK